MFYNFRRITHYLVIFTLVIVMSIAPVFATPVSDTATHNLLSNIYDKVETIRTYIATLINYFAPLSGDNLTISQQLLQIRNLISAVGSQTADVSSKLITTNNHLSNISGYTDGIEGTLTSIDQKTKDYTSYIENVQTYLYDIYWRDSNSSFIGYSFDINDSPTLPSTNTVISENQNIYLYFSCDTSLIGNNLIKILIPIRAANGYNYNLALSDFHIYNSRFVEITNYSYYTVDPLSNDLVVYAYNQATNTGTNNTLVISFHIDKDITYRTNYNSGIYYLNNDTKDYYIVAENIILRNQLDDINKLTDLYASEDLINAKNNQQNYEDQVIDDFTGSGSAAASGSDATSLKNISGSLKSGLNSGGSISNALGVFNDSSDLWKWFSQDNYNDINGSSSRSNDGIIDFYHINQDELRELLEHEYR